LGIIFVTNNLKNSSFGLPKHNVKVFIIYSPLHYYKMSKSFSLITCFLMSYIFASAQISGTVFRDLNADGALNANELSEGGILIVAYDTSGTAVDSVTTSKAAGDNYSFTGLTLPVRLEFRLPDFLFESKGITMGSSAQFYSAANTDANLPLQNPTMVCTSNPGLIVPCFVAGNPEGGGTGGSLDALVRYPYSNSGTTTAPTKVALASEIGTVWGSAYQRETKTIVLAEFLKRHCGIEALGLGGLYRVDINTSPGVTSSYINIENFGIDLGSSVIAARPTLPASATGLSNDAVAFDAVGKVGMGGIDLSDDGSELWIVNLYEKKLIRFDIGNPVKAASAVTAGDFTSFAIPDPGCTKGQTRPWAINYHQGKVYVGLVCSGEAVGSTAADLSAYIYAFDPIKLTWEQTTTFSLDYPKGDVHTSYPLIDSWESWVSVFTDLYSSGTAGSPAATRKMRPQAMLSDIVFDIRGDLTIGFMDRTGHQTGRNQYGTTGTGLNNGYIGGDILKMKANGTGGYILESAGKFSGGPTGSAPTNGQGPGGGEFYGNEFYSTIHLETFEGGLAYLPALDEIVANQMDPFGVFSGGTVKHSVLDGSSSDPADRYQVFNTATANGTFGKANGLGLMQLTCDPVPIEIGNRLWADADGDGIQDANELPLGGITVELYKNGVLVGTTTTSATGQFAFNNSNVNQNGATSLEYNTDYEVRVPMGQPTLLLRPLTTSNGGTSDLADNDATVVGANAVIPIKTGASGQNNFTLDFGFRNPPCAISIVTSTPSACDPATNTYTVSVAVTYSNAPTGDLTINGQTFTPNGSGSETFTLTGITANGATGVALNAAFVNDVTCVANTTYDAPIACTCPTPNCGTVIIQKL
jgi:SdrD B-like domain